jgi:hypothetical protein
LLDGTPLFDGNYHGLARLDHPKNDRPCSSNAGTDDVPFPGRLIEAVASLKGLGRAVFGGNDDSAAEDEAELAARVVMLAAPGRFISLDEPHDDLDATCLGYAGAMKFREASR